MGERWESTHTSDECNNTLPCLPQSDHLEFVCHEASVEETDKRHNNSQDDKARRGNKESGEQQGLEKSKHDTNSASYN